MDHYSTIKLAEEALKTCTVTNKPHVLALWRKVEFKSHKQQVVEADAEADRTGKDIIHLYPSIEKKDQPAALTVVLREFGVLIKDKASPDNKDRWENKWCLPEKIQIDSIQTKLGSGFETYRDLVESFGTMTDRLVAANVVNGMLSNRLAFAETVNINVRKYGPTAAYCTLRRYHSLTPVVSAYAPRIVLECFGTAFADAVIHELASVREMSVRNALHGIISDIVDSVR